MSLGDNFYDWLDEVDQQLEARCGMDHLDLDHQPWYDWFEKGMTTEEAALECLEREEFWGDIDERN